MLKKDIFSSYVLLSLLFLSVNTYSQVGIPPNPNAGTATVDGLISDWNLIVGGADWFAEMRESGKTDHPLFAHLYLKYDCESSIMYALIYKYNSIPMIIQNGEEVWIKINGSKVVSADNVPVDPTQPNFAWVNSNGTYADGWEASFSLADQTIPPDEPYNISVHVNVFSDGSQTCRNYYETLVVDCGVLPVEMTSFSVNAGENIATLDWETATEVNNYGFEVERKFNSENKNINWEKIGFVTGHGNSNSPKFYTFTDNTLNWNGEYSYRLKQIDLDGKFEYSKVINVKFNLSENTYNLNQNYPNPFNPSTRINFSIPERTHVNLIIYNIFGEEVDRPISEFKEAGVYSINYTAKNISSGIYFYSLETENYKATKKFIYLK